MVKDAGGKPPRKKILSEELVMKINKFLGFAATAALVLAPIVTFSTSAQAYPTGQAMTVTASKYTAVAGSEINVQANRVFPGCSVTFTLRSSSYSAVASAQGATKLVSVKVPAQAGTYELKAATRANCKPGAAAETATASIVVTARR